MNLNLTHLINFIQVVEWGNVSKAATYLNIAQPALSRQIQSLEATLNTKLLRRQNWGVEPTEDGRILLEHARRIQKECLSVHESVRSNRDSPVGSVYLGVPAAYAITLVPPLLQRMQVLYPNIKVHIVEAFSGTIYEWLVSGRLDLAVLYHSKEHTVKESTPFFVEELIGLTAPGMFPDMTELTLADLADQEIIAPWRPHLLRLVLDEKFIELGKLFTPKIELDSMPCMIEMARRGDGIVILPPSCVFRELSEGQLRGIPLMPNVKLSTALGKTPERQPTRAMNILTNVLRDLVVELAPQKGWNVVGSEDNTPS